MAEYRLGPGAEADLLEIARYTTRTWGWAQSERYLCSLRQHFIGLGTGAIRGRTVLSRRHEYLCSRCRHHFVFFVHKQAGGILVLGVFHEKMDLMVRLRERLAYEE